MLSKLFSCVLIAGTVLSVSSCKTVEKQRTYGEAQVTVAASAESVKDQSVESASQTSSRNATVLLVKESVPRSAVTLTIPSDSLASLPSGASYKAKNGQASAEVSQSGGNVIVYASCDSLERQCYYYEQLIAELSEQHAEQQLDISSQEELISALQKELEEQKEHGASYSLATLLKWFFIGILIGILTTTVIAIIKKRKS